MVEDARRRFAFGFTIENTSMRLWWCNRGLVVVSTPFNFVRVSAIINIDFLKPYASVEFSIGPHKLCQVRIGDAFLQ